MYRFTNKEDFLEFDVVANDQLSLSCENDATISVKFSINSFSAKAEVYTESADLKSFANSLIELELSRKGQVKLLSSRGDVFFEIRSLDMLGHIGIICNVSEYGFLGEEYRIYKSSVFFEIDPTQLAEFSNDSWVHVYKTQNSI